MAEHAERGETVDLVRAFALPLPLTVISEMLGVPDADRDNFHDWVGRFLDAPDGGPLRMLTMIPTANKMMKLFERLVDLRRREPDDRVISALVNSEGAEQLKQNEILAMIFLLLLAGHETTTSLIGSGALALVEHPDQKARLAQNPELARSTVEELLRYASPVTCGAGADRVGRRPELGGATIPKGARRCSGC